MNHLSTVPVRPSARGDRPIPPELEEIVLACLEKDPQRRPSSARELSDRLAALNIEAAWTERRAAEWWDEIEPARRARGGGGSLSTVRPFSLNKGTLNNEP
jgi:eukaryotic-like serine/threonine-protein kinase